MDYTKLASEESLAKTVEGLKSKGYDPIVVGNKEEALAKVKELIPVGVSVMNGSSVTLEQIGFVDYLKAGQHGWNNLHAGILAENDPTKRAELRMQSSLSEYYLGSVHAMIENGEFIVASNTASQLPHVVYTSKNLIFALSTKKIVPNLNEAMNRLEKHIIPLEDEHMKGLYGSGTVLNKIVIFKGESPHNKRKIHFVLVKEDLGF
jgi:hypothetical protein